MLLGLQDGWVVFRRSRLQADMGAAIVQITAACLALITALLA